MEIGEFTPTSKFSTPIVRITLIDFILFTKHIWVTKFILPPALGFSTSTPFA